MTLGGNDAVVADSLHTPNDWVFLPSLSLARHCLLEGEAHKTVKCVNVWSAGGSENQKEKCEMPQSNND